MLFYGSGARGAEELGDQADDEHDGCRYDQHQGGAPGMEQDGNEEDADHGSYFTGGGRKPGADASLRHGIDLRRKHVCVSQ